MTDLSTTYLGLNLANPLVASASPLSKKLDLARKLEEAGISAIVMYSLFEEQIIRESLERDHFLSRATDAFPEAPSHLPDGGLYGIRPEKYLNQVAGLKKALKIPVIGSLNGASRGGWTNYARKIEEAGADALELNMYYLAVDPDRSCIDKWYSHIQRCLKSNDGRCASCNGRIRVTPGWHFATNQRNS